VDLKREWFEKNLDHDVEPDEPKGWTKRRLLTIPGCCDESKILVTVVLGLSGNDIYENDKGQADCKPAWVIRSSFLERFDHQQWICQPRLIVKFCPHCGKPMPEIQKRKVPLSPIANITDGGYHCDTCNERLQCCNCWPCEAHWEVA